jgi:hypothetical protein
MAPALNVPLAAFLAASEDPADLGDSSCAKETGTSNANKYAIFDLNFAIF